MGTNQLPRSVDDRGIDRRALLGLVATSSLLAGCLGDDDPDDEPNGDDNPGDEANGDNGDPGDEANGDNGDPDGDDGEELDPEDLGPRAAAFVELLDGGEFEAAEDRVDPAVVEELSAPVLANAWETNVAPLGDLVEIVGVEFEGVEEGIAGFTVTAAFEERTRQFDVAYTTAGVAGFFIQPAEWTAPAYVDESAFTETDLELDAPGECSLGATLTTPEGAGEDEPVPGVVIVHGSGPIDRNGTVGPNRTYQELAWGLATRGIAVLRYDKRTFACDVELANVTIDDVITDDALTAVARLRERDGVGEVFVAGHSLGGLLAPRIAHRDGDLAGLVMLAPGPARPIADTIVAQQEHLLSLEETLTDDQREQALAEVEAIAEQIRTLDIADDEVVNELGGREYYESLAGYDHTGQAAALDLPIGLFQGGQDFQVTVDDDLPIWEEALDGAANVAVEVYDDLNHRFQVSEGERTRTEYFDPESPVAETLVEDVVSFVESA